MSFAQSLRTALPLVIGIAVGAVGAAMFHDSLPGTEGSPEERAAQLEVDLKAANNRLAALEGDPRTRRRRPGDDLRDGLRRIGSDVREGRMVDPDDIFQTLQPLMHELSPLLNRMRVREEKQRIESITGELARKYDLTADQQKRLKQWFEQKAEIEAKRWSDLVGTRGTTLEDLARASSEVRPDEGLDEVMGGILTGDKLADFQTDRMTERAQRVQSHADARVQRLDNIVGLDDAQRDQVFGIMARSSPDYDPAMKLEGEGGDIGNTPAGAPREAMLSVLRPEQKEAYEAARQRRREEAEEDMNAIGMKLPANWDLLDQSDF